jgi:hypothetical protein
MLDRYLSKAVLLLSASFAVALAPRVRADAPATKPAAIQQLSKDEVKFLRCNETDPSAARLETAIVTYRNDAGATVRLVGAIHIGEKSYYESLNDTFRGDDAVLYEMVKPKGADAPKPNQAPRSGIAKFQHFLKDTLNLDFQLDDVDYGRPNFVHADLDAETFEKMQADRGESMFTLMLQQMMNAMAHGDMFKDFTGDEGSAELIAMFCRPDAERQAKLLLARHMTDMEKSLSGLEGPDGSVIVGERNKAALKVLATSLKGGKKHISVFYGAAHMAAMSDSLQKDMGFKPVSIDWRTAWNLAIRADRPSMIEKILKDAAKTLDE